MGLVLVASGVLMLVSLVVRVNVLTVLLTFWPVILICLGLEILLHLFLKKNDDGKGVLRYDALSVIFIGFLLTLSIGFYAVTYYAGLFESREDLYAAFGVMNENVYVEDSVTLADTRELVVFDGINRITALPASDRTLKVDSSVSVRTHDKDYAEPMLGNVVRLEPGERTYLRAHTVMFHNNSKVGWPSIHCIVWLPPNTVLDLSQFQGTLEYDQTLENQIVRHQQESLETDV
jgi:hypothetical protein